MLLAGTMFSITEILQSIMLMQHRRMQRLMEKSALVIIDINNAIANGYASLFADVLDTMEDEEDA